MIALLRENCSLIEKARVIALIESAGLGLHLGEAEGHEVIGVVGERAERIRDALACLPGVFEVRPSELAYSRVSRAWHAERTEIVVGGVRIGGAEVVVIAGPCAVESEEQVRATARAVSQSGARLLRGGAFKPRTSPYSFQGLGARGLELLAAAGAEVGLPIVTEVVAGEDVELVARHADVLQVGARNMQNFRLLQAVGAAGKPVLLKRGPSATIEEFLLAAEYVAQAGNPRVILCERGLRSFDRATRNVLDLAALPLLRERTHLPVFADPSHGTGSRSLVPAMARAAVAAGADGLMIEVHPRPNEALSDGPQSLTLDGFARMMAEVRAVAAAVGRSLAPASARSGVAGEPPRAGPTPS
jgi:3-deoxy-7-phosphoheptulonate synthase